MIEKRVNEIIFFYKIVNLPILVIRTRGSLVSDIKKLHSIISICGLSICKIKVSRVII